MRGLPRPTFLLDCVSPSSSRTSSLTQDVSNLAAGRMSNDVPGPFEPSFRARSISKNDQPFLRIATLTPVVASASMAASNHHAVSHCREGLRGASTCSTRACQQHLLHEKPINGNCPSPSQMRIHDAAAARVRFVTRLWALGQSLKVSSPFSLRLALLHPYFRWSSSISRIQPRPSSKFQH